MFLFMGGAINGHAQEGSALAVREAAVIAKLEKYTGDNNGDGRRVIGFLGGREVKSLVTGIMASSVVDIADGTDAAGCDIVYVSDRNMLRWQSIQSRAPAALSVGESTSFGGFGGILMVVSEEGDLRLYFCESNFDRARESGLQLSSKLLKLARKLDE